jgi:glutamate-1-semialdehyde 2,1-aminomutase
VLTPQAFVRAGALGTRMVDGLRAAVAASGLAWSVAQMGPHAYYGFAPVPARDGAEARTYDHPDLRALMRLWLVNRGVWESGWWLGPTVSVAHNEADVDEYVARFAKLLSELTRPAE